MITTTGNTNMVKKALKSIMTFSAVFSFAASIWLVSAYFTKKDSSAVIVAEKVEMIIANQQQDKMVRDSILLKLNGLAILQDDVNKIQRSQTNLTNAMTNFIRNNKLATKQDLDNFIEELKKNNTSSIMEAPSMVTQLNITSTLKSTK